MNIGIVGLGLIGGSLAIDLHHQGHTVIGVSRRVTTCQDAIARGIVDIADTGFAPLSEADIVFLCTPLGVIQETVAQLIPHLPTTTILTDVGSVKQPIVEAIAPVWPNFIGGHPMAGTAESGLDAAQANLFAHRPYVLTPLDSTPPVAIQQLTEIVQSLGAILYLCKPSHHDQAVAWISHLPVMVSASLIQSCISEPDPNVLQLAHQLASSGFRDTSRVGGGNPELGVMMARYNRVELLRALAVYRQHLDQLMLCIEHEDWPALETQLTQTQQARPRFVDEPLSNT